MMPYIINLNICSTGPSGKYKIVYKLLSQPHKHLRCRKLKKHNSGKQPTAIHPKAIQCSSVKHTVRRSFHRRTWAFRKHLVNWDVLHLNTSNSNEWAAATARKHPTLPCTLGTDGSLFLLLLLKTFGNEKLRDRINSIPVRRPQPFNTNQKN